MAKVNFSEFDYNYHNSEKHYDSHANEEYVRHNIDIYNTLSFKGTDFSAVYQTGCSYQNNNYSSPSKKIELSDDGGTDSVLITINQMVESDFEDMNIVEYYIEECNSRDINNKDDLIALYEAINENLIQAQNYFDSISEDIEPVFLEA